MDAAASGQVMVGALCEADDVKRPITWVLRGGAWRRDEIPLPPDETEWYPASRVLDISHHRGKFVLLFHTYTTRRYVTVWSGGSWSVPEALPDELGRPDWVNFDAAGNLVTVSDERGSTGPIFGRRSGGQWSALEPSPEYRVNTVLRHGLTRSSGGDLHMLAMTYEVPGLMSVGAGADPLNAGNWSVQPPYDRDDTSPLTDAHVDRGTVASVVDWPRQTMWVSWQGNGPDRDKLFISHAPIGASSAGQWQTWTVEPEEGWRLHESRLVSSGAGAVGIVYKTYDARGSRITFRWLPPTGLGEPHELVRPGSQTEAADFTTIYNSTLAATVSPDGVAHVIMKGRKRGEYPENTDRLYHAQVSGGAVLGSGPSVAGGGGSTGPGEDWQQQGGKPDLQPVLSLRGDPVTRDGQEVYRFGHYDRLIRPEVGVRNTASQYFGDMEVDLIVDGAVVHYREVDDSNHMKPLIERDDTLTLYGIPGFRFESSPEDGWAPPEMTNADAKLPSVVSMRTGLGRKTVTVVVDPEGKIDEVDETNNTVELEWELSDGREGSDRLDLTDTDGNRVRAGHNDLAILGTPNVQANTPIAGPGLVQRPTEATILVANPRGAEFFRDVSVVALLDGDEIWRTVLPLIDAEEHLESAEALLVAYSAPDTRRGPDIRGGFLTVPVDLTDVPTGRHTLSFVVDPDDRFADLNRANNTADYPLTVREPGGTLQVVVLDRETNKGIPRASVLLQDMYVGQCGSDGTHNIPDVPAGNYTPDDLTAWRRTLDPHFARQSATQGFRVIKGGTTSVIVMLEKPVKVVVHVVAAGGDGSPLLDSWANLKHLEQRVGSSGDSTLPAAWRQGMSPCFPDLPPGRCEISAGAYAYRDATVTQEVHRDAKGECHVTVAVAPGPRGTVSGRVTDPDGDGVVGAEVWLKGAPRYATTDNNGMYQLTEVAADRQYVVACRKDSYAGSEAPTGTVREGAVSTANLTMARVTQKHESVFFEAVTWAIVEQWPGFNLGSGVKSEKVEVSAEFGKFNAGLGMLYHEQQGTDEAVIDDIVIGTQGGTFWEENVTYSYSLSSLLSTALEKVGGKHAAKILKAVSPINAVYGFIVGDVDYHELGEEGEVTGTFTTHTGADYKKPTLIEIPSIDFSPGMSGGRTVVRCDRLEASDGSITHVVNHQWYSPQMGAYHVGEAMDLDNLEVTFYVSVLNEDLSSGLLGDKSKNVIIWKPKSGTVRFEGRAYDPLAHLNQ